MSLFRYKGFYGSAQASIEDHCLFGKLEFIEPLVSYEGQNVVELEQGPPLRRQWMIICWIVKSSAGNQPNPTKVRSMYGLARNCTGMRLSPREKIIST